MKISITEITLKDVELEFDRLDDGTTTNYRYVANISAGVISHGQMTEQQFKDEIFKALALIK